MSKQHVFPDRLRHVLPRGSGTRQTGAYSLVRKRGKTVSSDQAVKLKQGSVGQSRVRKVCKTCNEGWLKLMEEDCFPLVERLIQGNLRLLGRPEQTKIARVATSMAMAGEWLISDYVTTTQAEREEFRRTLDPPPTWCVFIGRCGDAASTDPQWGSEGLEEVGSDAPKNYAAFTMIMGPVLLHAISVESGVSFFDSTMYAKHLKLAPICPTVEWINFAMMPALDPTGIELVRTYAAVLFRKMIEGN